MKLPDSYSPITAEQLAQWDACARNSPHDGQKAIILQLIEDARRSREEIATLRRLVRDHLQAARPRAAPSRKALTHRQMELLLALDKRTTPDVTSLRALASDNGLHGSYVVPLRRLTLRGFANGHKHACAITQAGRDYLRGTRTP